MNEKIPEGINNYAFGLLVNQKKSLAEVKQLLLEKDVSEEEAEKVIRNIQEKIANARKARAKNDMLYGGIILGCGLALTFVTYMFGGGVYILAWGAILFGAIRFIRGILNS